MYKFKIQLAYNKNRVIDTCLLEIIAYHIESEGNEKVDFQWNISLNRQEVKALLDLMQEAYAKMGKKVKDS